MESIKKEMQTRNRILNIYNKRPDEFPSKKEFDDYLEEREDIILKLAEGIDVSATELKIAEYKRQNQQSINENRIRKLEEQRAEVESAKAKRLGINPLPLPKEAATSSKEDRTQIYKPAKMVTSAVPGGPSVGNTDVNDAGDVVYSARQLTNEQWKKMADASGWSTDTYQRHARAYAVDSLYI